MVKIHTDFPDPTDTALIQQICEAHEKEDVHVSSFKRFGKSGAHLLLTFFNEKPLGPPFLIKICKRSAAIREHEATKRLFGVIGDCEVMGGPVFTADKSADKWGAFLLSHKGSAAADYAARFPLSFRDVMYHRGRYRDSKERAEIPSINLTVIERTLTTALSLLTAAHSRSTKEKHNLREIYFPYFRKHASKRRIRQVLRDKANVPSFQFMGKQIENPLLFLEELPQTFKLCIGPVHGDLHPDNIILDSSLNPRLIDFAWGGHNRDILVDYVLLECSIRFWHFPGCANLTLQGNIDEMLLAKDGYADIHSVDFHEYDNKHAFLRLAKMIKIIRMHAESVLGDSFSMRNYLLAQFIVLYGLAKFDDYDPYVTTRALGMIARRLKKTL